MPVDRDKRTALRAEREWPVSSLWMFLAVVATGAVLWMLYELRGMFGPILLAWLAAYLCQPLVAFGLRWKVDRRVTALMILLLLAGVLAVLSLLVLPPLIDQVQMLLDHAPAYVERLGDWTDRHLGMTLTRPSKNADPQEKAVQMLKPLLQKEGTPAAIVDVLTAVLGLTTASLLSLALFPIYFFVFCTRFDRLWPWLQHYVPKSRREGFADLSRRMAQAFTNFFRGRLLIALISAALYSIAWALASVPYWVLLGLLTGFLTIVPYVSIIGWPLAVLFKYFEVGQAGTWTDVVVWPSVAYLSVQLFEGWVLTLLIQSHETELSPAAVLLAVLIGGAVGGGFGLLFAVPVAACLKIFCEEVVLPRLHLWASRH